MLFRAAMYRSIVTLVFFFFFSSRRRHTRFDCDWSSDVCSSDLGFGKRTKLEEYRFQSRGGKGVINMKTSDRNGLVVAVLPVNDESQLMMITNQGKMIRIDARTIRVSGRSTQGVKLIDTSDGDMVSSASL